MSEDWYNQRMGAYTEDKIKNNRGVEDASRPAVQADACFMGVCFDAADPQYS